MWRITPLLRLRGARMTARCKHEHARPSRYHDSWLWCESCKGFIKKKEVTDVRFDQEAH